MDAPAPPSQSLSDPNKENALEFAQLAAMETQLERMKVCCDSVEASTASTVDARSASSSPTSDSGVSAVLPHSAEKPPIATPARSQQASRIPTPVSSAKRRSLGVASPARLTASNIAASPAPVAATAAAASAGSSGLTPPTATNGLPGAHRLGMTARLHVLQQPERRVRRIGSTTDIGQRLRTGLPETVSKVSSLDTRRAYALTMRARVPAVAEARKGISHQPSPSSVARKPLTRRKSAQLVDSARRTSLALSPAPSESSPLSPPSPTSSVGSTVSSTASATRVSSRVRNSASVVPSSAAASRPVFKMSPPTMPMAADPDTLSELDSFSLEDLKHRHAETGKGAQELLKRTQSSTVNVKARQEDVKLLKGGIRQLTEHSETLMSAFEALERKHYEQTQEIVASDAEIKRLHSLLESSSVASVDGLDDDDAEEDTDAGEEAEDDDDESASPAAMDSPLSIYVKEMMKQATERIEQKWKGRFAEQVAEHERALAQERERSSASIVSNSLLATETKHEKEDEVKAIREENIALHLQTKHLQIELDTLKTEVDFMKKLLDDQDDEKSSSAHSFWQKTTDLAKQNRNLTEEITLLNQTVNQLNEVIKNQRLKDSDIKSQNEAYVKRAKECEIEARLVQDTLTAVEQKFEDEKARREQFQVNVEQLTVENTALYAQMVALQTTHEAKMEEMRARFEKRNVVLAGEMKVLQTQNRLMRSAEPTAKAAGYVATAEEDREMNERLQEMADELLSVRQELSERTDQIAELEKKLAETEIIRRKLHNTVQELRGNIRVHVRLRPFLRSDGMEALVENPMPAISSDTFASTLTTRSEKPHTFAFDKIYGQSDTQEVVFKDVSDFIQSAMDGYNVCIFAYGQTGSGKTHTMQGSGKAQMRGIIPRSIHLIIQCCEEFSTQGWRYSLDVSFYEIYNETIRDLLSADNGDDARKYNIRTDKRGKNYVEGLTTISIDFAIAEEQVEDIVNIAACNRSVDKTDMNAHSSRSHSIFALTIRGYNEAQNTEVEGSLSLVDLAGSERLSRSNATGDRLKEAQAINKSLSSLADVFQALAKKSAHVPYRNSKLTYVLQPALSGDGKTLMMVNLSPTVLSIDESLCSLRFAQNVSQCELGAPVRQIKSRASAPTSAPSSGSSSAGFSSNVRSSPARMSTVTRRQTLTPAITKRLFHG